MTIGNKEYEQIVISNESGEVLAVISDKEIIEADGCKVTLDLT